MINNILYIDCFSGISGDMMAGALIDLGMDINYLKNELEKIDLDGYIVDCDTVKVDLFFAKKFKVEVISDQPLRNYTDIKKIINFSGLGGNVKKIAAGIFEEIARAEAKVHNEHIDNIHFHEVGAVDTIVDILAAAIGIDYFKFDLIISGDIPLGKGIVKTSHGNIPIPAPATLEILKGLPVYGGDFDFEVTTPTGAAILKAVAERFEEIPLMKIEKVGIGAGSIKNRKIPNVLRILKGSLKEKSVNNKENLILLCTNIDDSNPQIMGYLIEKLIEKKALDAWIEPVIMKKSRPAFKLCVLCTKAIEYEIVSLLFTESSTLGIRRQEIERYALKRKVRRIKLPYGEVDVKIGVFGGREITFLPEYESCKRLAQKLNRPLKEIYQDVIFLLSSK